MKKIIAIILSGLMLASVIPLSIGAAEKADGYIIYENNFDDGTYDVVPYTNDTLGGKNVTKASYSVNNGKLIINNVSGDETSVNGAGAAFATIVPNAVMSEYKEDNYTIEYDMTFITAVSPTSGATVIPEFQGERDVYSFVFPYVRGTGKGNGWNINDGNITGTHDTATQLSGNAWISNVTGNTVVYSNDSTFAMEDITISYRIDCGVGKRDVYAKYGTGEWMLISNGVEGDTYYTGFKAYNMAIGMYVDRGVAIELDNIRVYKGISVSTVAKGKATPTNVIYSENFENDDNGDFTAWATTGATATYKVTDGQLIIDSSANTAQTVNTGNSMATIVPNDVMSQYAGGTYTVEYDVKFMSVGDAASGAGVMLGYKDTSNYVWPLIRANGKGNGWTLKNGGLNTYDADPYKLSTNTYLSTISIGGTLANEGLDMLSIKHVVRSTGLDTYAKYGSGDYVLISRGNAGDYNTVMGVASAIGFSVNGGVKLALDNIKVYTGSTAPDDFRYAGYQLATAASEGSEAIRFLATVDNYENYSLLGMDITATVNGVTSNTVSKTSSVVYHSIVENVDGVNERKRAEELGGEFIFAVEIASFPRQDTVYTIKLTYEIDGTPGYGTEIWTLSYDAETRTVTQVVTLAN